MVSAERISFVTAGHHADERLIREYVVPEFERLNDIEGCRGIRFTRFGVDPRWEKSEVKLGIYGDYENVIRSEREVWDDFSENGLIESWSRDGPPFRNAPDEVQEFMRRAYLLASEMAVQYYREFEDRPDLVDEFPETPGRSIGLWITLHVLVNQLGYDATDEIDAAMLLIRSRLNALTEFRNHDYARERVTELRDRLDDVDARIDELEAQGGFEYYSGPSEE